jgi:hypothetical protein
MSIQECSIVQQYVNLLVLNKRIKKISQENGEFWQLNGDPLTDSIGLVYQETVIAHIKKKVNLSYSMLRRWNAGASMPWHRNRWEAEWTVLIQISDNNWPIGFTGGQQESPYIEGQQSSSMILTPSRGDAVIFNASENFHSRHKLKGSECTTLCLYYTEVDGYLDCKDNRDNYGDNYKTKQLAEVKYGK